MESYVLDTRSAPFVICTCLFYSVRLCLLYGLRIGSHLGLLWCMTTAHGTAGLLPSLAGAWLWLRGGQSLQWGMPSGTNKLEVQNGTCQHQHEHIRMRLQKRPPPLSLSLESNTTNFLSSISFKTSKWISFAIV